MFYAIAGFAVAGAVMYVMARQMGLDPFAPNVRTLSSLALVVAVYVGIRIAMIVRALERRSDRSGEAAGKRDGRRGPSTFRKWGRNSELDARMEKRRERVKRARESNKTDEG